jgi:hypothetical protein
LIHPESWELGTPLDSWLFVSLSAMGHGHGFSTCTRYTVA